MTKDKLAEEDKKSYLGALEVNYYVQVKLNNELIICKIIAKRKVPQNENDENPNESSYEYCMHYIKYDRKNDHLIKRKSIVCIRWRNKKIKK